MLSADMDQFDLHFDKLRVNKVTVRGISPAEEIVNYADSNEAALIVMDTWTVCSWPFPNWECSGKSGTSCEMSRVDHFSSRKGNV